MIVCVTGMVEIHTIVVLFVNTDRIKGEADLVNEAEDM